MAHWSHLSACLLTTVVLTALVCAGCTSPGTPFAYKDVKLSVGPSASPAQPVVAQATTISFTIRNTWNKPLADVAWELRETSPATSTLASGTVDLTAFGSVARSVVITPPAKGIYTYQVVVDPSNLIVEVDETNNTSGTLTVISADQDLAFSSTTSPVVTWPTLGNLPSSSATPTLAFTLTNTPAAGVAGNSPAVPYTITRNGAAFGFTPVGMGDTSPVTVSTAGQTVTVTLPATGSAGTFEYTITLSPDAGDDRNITNNEVVVTVVIPAGA